jgi:hypothetical protein
VIVAVFPVPQGTVPLWTGLPDVVFEIPEPVLPVAVFVAPEAVLF